MAIPGKTVLTGAWQDITTALTTTEDTTYVVQNVGESPVIIKASTESAGPSATDDVGGYIFPAGSALHSYSSGEKLWGRAVGANNKSTIMVLTPVT